MKPREMLVIVAVLLAVLPPQANAVRVGDVVAGFPASRFPTGLAWDGKNLWICDRDLPYIYALDRATGARVDSVMCPAFSPLDLAWGDGFLWVSSYEEGGIYKIDMAARRVVDIISAPSEVTTGLAWHGGRLWASDASAGTILELDPLDGTPLRSFKAPSSAPNGLASDGTYLWVSDRRKNKIYMVEPENGWVILEADAPGPYARGLACDGDFLYNVDYQTDSLYVLSRSGDENFRLYEPKRARVRFTFKARCEGPDDFGTCNVYLALPQAHLRHQVLLSDIVCSAEMAGIVEDKWGQEFFRFTLEDLKPGEERRVWYKVDAEISKMQFIILPGRVGSKNRIPADIRAEYTVDGARLQIDDPYMQAAIKEAVGDEDNPYYIVRRIFEYVNDRVEYERVGGWDTAPNILKRGTGSCSEYSFVFMAMARGAGIPTRFCAGVVERGDEASMDDVFHRWTEVYLPGYGWVPVDVSAGDDEWPADRAAAIGSFTNRILITTIGGGDSEYVGWGYNYGYTIRYEGRSSLATAGYADWAPLE
jgi:transglutaminase-like putative cysteine protease